MSRSATYTIKGFLYQFNKTLLEILRSNDDDIITVEGIVEDVEVVSDCFFKAIQCKYHETIDTFTLSTIYKPLLQMMLHFQKNPLAKISYILFAHFPSMSDESQYNLKKEDLESALNTNNEKLKKMVESLKDKIDLDLFLLQFKIEFGLSYDKLTKLVSEELEKNQFPKECIDTVGYPNAINMVAEYSIKHNVEDRKVTKRHFLEDLNKIHKTTISRWTLVLNDRKKILETKRKQLKSHLSLNTRLRFFIIDCEKIEDFNDEIIILISDYLNKYHYKLVHINTPLFCFFTTKEKLSEINHRLYQKNIISTDGYFGANFEISYFLREPIINKSKKEFSLRLILWENFNLIKHKCDDLFIVGNIDISLIDTTDINVEVLQVTTLKEIKYLLGVCDIYE